MSCRVVSCRVCVCVYVCIYIYIYIYTHTHTRPDPTRPDTTRHDTTRHDTTRHDTTRHDTTRHDTTQHRISHYLQIVCRVSKRRLSTQERAKETRDTYGIVGAAKELRIGDRIAEVGSDDVEAKPLRRFIGHLYAVL